MGRMRVGIVQFAAALDIDENLKRLTGLSADLDVDLIVVPEAAMHDFGEPDNDLASIAQPLDGPFVSSLTELARDRNAFVVAGMFEWVEGELPYNTVVVVGADAALLAAYRKVHLYDSFGYRESDRVQPGPAKPTVVDIGDFRIGVLTCYDLRFPEHTRALVDSGADTVVVPSAWVRGPHKENHWRTLLRARAIENTIYVVAAAQTGKTYCGNSMVTDPMGVVTAAIGEQEGAFAADLDLARIASARDRNPALLHRRFGSIR